MRAILMVGAALFVGGCANIFDSPNQPDPVVKVMASVSDCGVELPAIYAARGPSAEFSPDLRRELADISLPAEREALVVALGAQPTPGYTLTVLNARWFGDATLNVSMLAQTPSDDSFSAQVISYPCVVIDVPALGWDQIRVEADLPDFPIAWVRRDD